MGDITVELAVLISRYSLPVEDAYILWSGVDFDGIEQSRWWAAGGITLALAPGGKVFKPVANISGNFTRFFAGMGGELVEIIIRNGIPEFTADAIKALAKKATKNAISTKVMLGKEFFAGTIPYYDRASSLWYKYFRLEPSNWSNISSLIGENFDEMWKINKQFIDDAISANNSIYLSHSPLDPEVVTGFYAREINYLITEYGATFTKISDDLWKVFIP